MPWQRLVADVGGELLDDGTPAYRTVRFSVPRQNGKTTEVLAWEIHRALHWADILDAPQRIAYTAQTGQDARDKLINDQFPILEPRRKELGIRQLRRANGSESVDWRNNSKLILLASDDAAGHGKILDLGVQDELWKDVDYRRDQAMGPSMITRAYAQKVQTSTAGTGDSIVWNDCVATGRAAAEARRTHGLAYFEWSADEDADPADPATWWSCMPALGRTIGLAALEHEYNTLPLGEFKRAFLNIPTSAGEQVIPQTAWDLVNTPDVEATATVFALDCNPERSAGAIAAAGPGPIVEIVEYRAGVGWMVETAADLHRRYRAPFVIDVAGPAGSFLTDLRNARVELIEVGSREVAQVCGAFYDAVVTSGENEARLRIRRDTDLDAAVAGAVKQNVGDAWRWGRKSSKVDISPLMAATLALGQVDVAATEPAVGGDVDEARYAEELASLEEAEARAIETLEAEGKAARRR